jgi:hypothetical protein
MKIKNKILLSVITSMVLSTNSFAFMGVGDFIIELTAGFEKGIDMISQNTQESMSQWASSTARNGSNAAAESMRSCVANAGIDGLMSSLGGLSIDLPCGEVWSIDNPINNIVESVSYDMSSSINGWIDDTIENITNLDNYMGLYCKKDVEFVPNLADYFITMNDKDFDEMIKERMSIFNKTCEKKSDEINDITSSTAASIISNKIKGVDSEKIGQKSYSTTVQKQLLDREEQLLKNKIDINKNDNKKLSLINPADPESNHILLNGGDTVEDIMAKKMILENCDSILDTDLKAECLAQGNKGLTDKDKEDNIRKIEDGIKIPIPFFHERLRESENKTNGTYDSTIWKTSTPYVSIKYVTPYELSSYSLIDSENGIKVEKFDNISKNSKTKMTGKEEKLEDVFLGKGLNEKVKTEWVDSVKSSVSREVEGKIVPKNWNGSSSMDLLLKATNLLNSQIINLGSENGNALMEINLLKGNLNSKTILVSQLQKLLDAEINNSVDTNSFENRTMESVNQSQNEQLIVLNKLLLEIKEMKENRNEN